ncbi:MAG: hypothetical protein U9O65_00480 [Thermotogota bacterium]|nr:hypothetical protein [Thermotogota bacterium]
MKRISLFILTGLLVIFLLTACPPKEILYLNIEIETTEDASGSVYPFEGEYLYYEGMTQEIIAAPSESSVFERWIIDGIEETKASTTITINKSLTATAYFENAEPPGVKYTLTVLKSQGEGEIELASGTYEYAENSVISLTATPADGWEFVKWEVDGTEYSTEDSTTLIMDADKEVSAYFEEISPEEYTLFMLEPEGEGDTSPTSPGTYTYEEEIEIILSATPTDGWKFIKWEVNGEFYSSRESATLLMNSNKEVKVFFSNDSEGYILTTIVEGDGRIKIEPEKNTYSQGEIVELEAIPDNCSSFVKWDGDIISEKEKIELIMDNDKIVYAAFKENDKPPSVEIISPQPVPEYVNDLSKEFEFAFSPSNEGVNLHKISAEICSDNWTFNSNIYDNVGRGELVLSFDQDKVIDCETYYATITVEDCCGNVASKQINLTIDNILPKLDFSVCAFKNENNFVETTLSWTATDTCFDKIRIEVNKGTTTETYTFVNKGNTKWIIPVDELNEENLVVRATAYDKAGNTETVSRTIPVRKLSMRVNSENAGSVSPAPGDHYYPSSVRIGLSAVPDTEYAFDKWIATAGSFEDEASAETKYLMPDQNATITANFTPIWKGFTENQSILQQTANVSVNKPPGVETGDMIIVILHTDNRIDDKWANDPSSLQGFSIIGHSTNESDYERPTVSAAYKIAGENEPASYSFEISEEMHWYITAICINKFNGIGTIIRKTSGEQSVESITFDNLTTSDKSLIIAAITQRRSTDSDYNARSIVPPQGMKERYSYYSFETFGEDGKPNASGASKLMKPGQIIKSPTYSWDYTGRAAGIMFEIILND